MKNKHWQWPAKWTIRESTPRATSFVARRKTKKTLLSRFSRLGHWWREFLFALIVHIGLFFMPVSMPKAQKPPERIVKIQLRAAPAPQPVKRAMARQRPKAKPIKRRKVRPRRKVKRRKVRRRRKVARRKIARRPVPRPIAKKAEPVPVRPEPVRPTPVAPKKVAMAAPAPVRPEPPKPPAPKVEARPAPRPKPVNFGPYRRSLYHSIAKKKNYPYMARRLGQEGKVLLLIQISREGKLLGAPRILRSSGHDLLDQEAVRMVRAASPWPIMPDGFQGKLKRFRVPVRFALN